MSDAKDGRLNPEWAAWFMGFDPATHLCGDTAMQSLSRSRPSSSPRTSKRKPT
jgi:hypothetical protein